METIRCEINGIEISCEAGQTVLEAARENGIEIPTLCYLAKVNRLGACRVCVVQIEGMPRLMPACITPVRDGMVIHTESEAVVESRRQSVDLLCKRHRMDCEYCPHYTFCELHAIIRKLGIDDRKYSQVYHARNADESSKSIVRDNSKCIRCRRCVSTCKAQGIEAIGTLWRGENAESGSILPISETNCIGCGQCVKNCPTGALFVKDDTDLLWRALNNKKRLVFGIQPETAAGIARFFGAREPINEIRKLTAVLKKCGAYAVCDLTGLQETVLAGRSGEVTVCPAQVHPELPHTEPMDRVYDEAARRALGEEIFTVYVSGCTAAKREPHADAVLTTTELFAWVQRACVSRFTTLDTWEKAAETEPMRLFAASEVTASVRYICPGGCKNGGGQFRTQGYQKEENA